MSVSGCCRCAAAGLILGCLPAAIASGKVLKALRLRDIKLRETA